MAGLADGEPPHGAARGRRARYDRPGRGLPRGRGEGALRDEAGEGLGPELGGDGVLRVEAERLGEVGDRPAVIADLVAGQPPPEPGVGVSRLASEGLVEVGDRPPIVVQFVIGLPPGDVRRNVVGPDPDRVGVVGQRGAGIARAMARDRAARFGSAREALAALAKIGNDAATTGVLRKKKQGFGPPWRAWLENEQGRVTAMRRLRSSDLVSQGYISDKGIKLVAERGAASLWALLVLDEWMRQYN